MIYHLRTITEADLEKLDQLQRIYTESYPPRRPNPSPLYVSPYFDHGKNVICAFDEHGAMLAFAPFFPQGNLAWVEVEALPGLPEMGQVKDALWAWLLDRARQDGMQKLCFQYFPNEREAISFAESQGAAYQWSIFTMQRDLSQPIPLVRAPQGFTIHHWRIESEVEQRQYLDARNASFPEATTSLEEWQYFIRTPLWTQGVNMAAFCGDTLAASVLVFWEPGSPSGSTEYVFTLPEFRGQGLARCLLSEALRYLEQSGLQAAVLEVKAGNRMALGVYQGIGYEVVSESNVYEVLLTEEQ